MCGVFRISVKISDVRGSAARPVLRRSDEIQGNPTRSTEIRRNRHLLGAIGRNFAPRRSVADCVEYPGNPEKPPLFADTPPGRFCGEGVIFREIIVRSAEIRRNHHLPGTNGRYFLPHGSVGDCVESSEIRENRRFSDPPPGWFCGDGGRFRGTPPARPQLIEIEAYMVRKGGIPYISA